MRTSVVVVALIVGVFASGVAMANPELVRLKGEVEKAEQNQASGDVEHTRYWVDRAKGELQSATAATKAEAEFAKLQGRVTAVEKKLVEMEKGATASSAADKALKDAFDARRSADGRRAETRSGRTGFEMAEKYYEECVTTLEGAFATDPSAKTKVVDKESGEQILKSCKERLAEVQAGHAKLQKKEQGEADKIVRSVHKLNWDDAQKFLERARKRLAKKDDFGIINGTNDLTGAVQRLGNLIDACKQYVTPAKLGDLELAKGLKANEMCVQSQKLRDDANAQLEKWRPQLEKASDRLDQKILKSVSGDRARIMKSAGSPSWFDGADLVDAKEWFQAVLKSSYYRYDNSNGCQITYHFKGNVLKKTLHEPRGCTQ